MVLSQFVFRYISVLQTFIVHANNMSINQAVVTTCNYVETDRESGCGIMLRHIKISAHKHTQKTKCIVVLLFPTVLTELVFIHTTIFQKSIWDTLVASIFRLKAVLNCQNIKKDLTLCFD